MSHPTRPRSPSPSQVGSRVLDRRAVLKGLAGAAGLAASVPLLAACGSGGGGAGKTTASATAAGTAPSTQALQRQALPSWLKLPDINSLKTRGNVGEQPTWYSDVKITDDQVRQVRAKNLKGAFLNWSSGAYNQAVLAGAKDAMEAMGIRLVAVTNYNFDEAAFQRDVVNVLPLDPDIIFYSGVDPTADRAALKPAVDAGVGVVSFANAPGGWTAGNPTNFVTLISYDTYGDGAAVAEQIAKRFPNGAKLGMIFYDKIYKLVNEREKGFVDALSKTKVQIVTRQPMTDPSVTQPIAAAMITRYPDLDVIFAPWDLPADGVLAALHAAQKNKIAVANIDIGFSEITSMACGGPVICQSSQLVYEWGRTGAIAAALHVLGQPVPPYIISPVFAVTKDNLEEGWNLAYGGLVPLPAAAKKCLH